MMNASVPLYINVAFILTTLLTVYLFLRASHKSNIVLIIIATWLVMQGIIACLGYYTTTNTFPPRIMLSLFPPIIIMALLFISKKGQSFISHLNPVWLCYIHIVRIPVELILFGLFLHKQIPIEMTFEGRNFDILAGISAPFIAYFGYYKKALSKKMLLGWNLFCLGLLINIVVTAVLSVQFPLQQFGFEQPNVAVLYFPIVWLPACVVPIVLLSHLTLIKQLLR